MRETTAGITAFTTDDAVTVAVFSVDGEPFAIALDEPDAMAIELPHPGPVVDPRISPDGRVAAFVHDRGLYVVDLDGRTPARPLALAEHEHDSWGLADFVAAEELGRVRGTWWLAGSDALLAERVDEADVEVRWIADPAHPEREPRAHRYPMAGTTIPESRLFLLRIDGEATEIEWDHEAFPYLATVETDDSGGAVISVLSRDQTTTAHPRSSGRTGPRRSQANGRPNPGSPCTRGCRAARPTVACSTSSSTRPMTASSWSPMTCR